MEKQMRIELANEYPGGDGYYYASLELPAEEYEIRDALQKIRAVGRENVSPEISVLECGLLPELLDVSEWYTIIGLIERSGSTRRTRQT